MNILPKKRWHVRTKDNIARVRRDEAEAAQKEKERQRKILLAEQEARTDLLRKKSKSNSVSINTETNSKEISIIQNGHLNFFQDIEKTGGYVGGDNKEHIAEKKAEQEKYEKSIGILTYLGQGSSEQTGEKPWYLRSHEERVDELKDSKDAKKQTKGHKNKEFLDPLNEVKQYLDLSFGKEKPKDKRKEKEELKQKALKELKRKHTKNQKSSNSKPSIAELRMERLKREKEERERTRLLLERIKGGPPKIPTIAVDERRNQYNSQFNPHIARQNQSSLQEKFYK